VQKGGDGRKGLRAYDNSLSSVWVVRATHFALTSSTVTVSVRRQRADVLGVVRQGIVCLTKLVATHGVVEECYCLKKTSAGNHTAQRIGRRIITRPIR